MEVHLNPEREARLTQIATRRGLDTDELAQQVLSSYLDNDARFVEAVNVGPPSAGQGDFLEQGAVWATAERILRS
jgi:hypothetical protein